MNKSIVFAVILALVLLAVFYFWPAKESSEVMTEQTEESSLEPAEPLEPTPPKAQPAEVAESTPPEEFLEPLEPLELQEPPEPPEPPEEPLPTLDESDDFICEIMGGLFGEHAKLLLCKSFIRHFVVTVDNMTNRKLPGRYAFAQRPPGKFKVLQQQTDTILIDPRNYARYSRFIELAELVNNEQLVSVYVRYYPLFQQAYEELGYPEGRFNTRLLAVIDHLLAVPEVRAPIELVRPNVFYQFADPALEALSAGQKLLMRIGPDNAVRIKTKLQALRPMLASHPQLVWP